MNEELTIALPVYKRTDYVKEALESAINQSVKCSVLLIDNNSPHNDFKKILDGFGYEHATYIKTDETVPQDENFNNCFRYAKTPWVTILHDDDILHYQFVEHTKTILERFDGIIGGVTYRSHVSDKVWHGLNETTELTSDIKLIKSPFFIFSHLTPFPGVVLKTDSALRLGGFKNELHPIADFDFWYRYSLVENMLLVDQPMAYYRISPTQSTNHLIKAMINDLYEYRLKILKESKNNNFISRLGLEDTRLTNIAFFENTYDHIELPEVILNESKMRKAEKQLRNKLIRGVVRRYKKRISFEKL